MQRERAPSPLARIPWDDVRLFLAVYRARNLGEAARALQVNASTVSRRLDELERGFSAVLFERGRAGVAPSQFAEELMPIAEEIEQAMARFAQRADAFEKTVSGVVRLSCPPDLADVLVAPLVPELRTRFPQLCLELAPSEGLLDLGRHQADIAVRTVRPDNAELIVSTLGTVRWVLAASPELVRATGTLRAWRDVPWIAWGERFAMVPAARWLATHVPDAERVVRSDSMLMQFSLAKLGVGVALVPEPSLSHYGLEPVRIAPALASTTLPVSELHLITHGALRRVPRVRVLWELLVERVGQRLDKAALRTAARSPPRSLAGSRRRSSRRSRGSDA